MRPGKILTSIAAAAALSAVITAPTLAGAPTYSGTATCVDSLGDVADMNTFDSAPKSEVNWWGRYWTQAGSCEKGTWDTSELVKD